ncbi:MAG: hypothetical protein QF492_03735 [Candidatus Krumholzibacteria bacterium]|jgi:hypothetical protein|nr:hypothetical protein [Candidatus Krumholzibacteria bacterium]MDP6669008.1 hypothetical protein [Candidatus Krumholzibacteria bacterium]MDP6796710.1 hypothetical protein [Candidatus Krumholzibacteria bacterium]MDP7021726.1 hypothetical protein [Candidatus Krumholzibacteria bacterium]
MAKRKLTFALAALLTMGIVSVALAGIPNSANSTASAANCGRFTIAPSGAEDLSDNGYVISVTVLDIYGDPVVTLAATDLTLYNPQIVTCAGQASQADSGTDANGQATFSGTILGGVAGDGSTGVNCNDTDLYVLALDIVLNNGNPVCVSADSPDLDGSLTVNVSDLAKFASDFNTGTSDPCHDYNEDGATDVADLGFFASFYAISSCN